MRMIIKSVLTAVVCICLLLQTGCWDQKLYEDIGFILQMGLERGQDDKILFSMTTPVVAPDVKGKAEFLHISQVGPLRDYRERLRNVSGKQLQGGKIQIVYFSKDMAREGVNRFFDIFFRYPENPLLANVVVVDGSPKEMMELSMELEDKPRPAFYVTDLLEDARRRLAVPETRIFNFSILYYSKTIDPVTPLVRYNNKHIEIAGAALFSGDKMVGEIDTGETMLLNTLMGKDGGGYIYKGRTSEKNKEGIKSDAAISIKGSKVKIKIDTDDKVPMIYIDLGLKAYLDEYEWDQNLDEGENKKRLEGNIADSIKADILNLLKKLQNMESDPIGFGEMVRTKKNPYWKSVIWKEEYKDAVFHVDVKMNIVSYGTIK